MKCEKHAGRGLTMSQLTVLLAECPVVAAIKDDAGLEACLRSESRVIFVLYGSVVSIGGIVERLLAAGKYVFVHVDLLDGLSAREAAIAFVAENTGAHGVISTRYPLLRYARTCGLLTIQRFFLLDSLALENVEKQRLTDNVDMLEILPGLMPKIIRQLTTGASLPIIAGGLIRDKEDILTALSAGAAAISSTNAETWFM